MMFTFGAVLEAEEVQTQEVQEAQERLDITSHHQLYLFRQDRLALHWKWQWAVVERAVVQGVEHLVECIESGDSPIPSIEHAAHVIEIMKAENLKGYARLCGMVLARAHARSGDAAVLSGYMGKSDAFEDALADFSEAYADQNERDYDALVAAVRSGKIEAYIE